MTIYYGEPRWSAARTLIEMMKCPDTYNGIINDWNANIIDIKDIDYSLFENEDNRNLVKGIQMFYQGDMKKFKPHMRVSKDIAILIISIVNNGEFLEIIKEEEGEKVDMCTLIDTIKQECEKKGRISLLIELLKNKFNPLSQDIVIEIENSNFEQLDSLKTHFYELNKQEDIIKVLNYNRNND